MPLLKSYLHHIPRIAPDVFLAENAVVIGEVSIGAQSNIWYNVVIRGDVGAISIGERTNVQDGVMVHCTINKSQTRIGNDVIVGHHAVLHGCTIEDEVLIGMNAVVLDLAVVQRHVIVAAGAVVPEGMVLESGWLYAGVPVKKIKPLSAEQIGWIKQSAINYLRYTDNHRQSRVLSREETMPH
ncbi:MAG: gamma carbonic anhydrase family protein [Bacteroidia bacterium]